MKGRGEKCGAGLFREDAIKVKLPMPLPARRKAEPRLSSGAIGRRSGGFGGKRAPPICFCETNPIYVARKTAFIPQSDKGLHDRKADKTFGFVLENEPNFRRFGAQEIGSPLWTVCEPCASFYLECEG